ncbi:MAG: hypothetical protein HS131_03790 [Ignavibacteriales bacterium]|jgi:rubrerythrin|nr:hypothetical protein [Ignavibacteriales bacterium]MCC7092992.1 hypothetical protein [Ignavibacteriaceae bacterium]MCL4278494.1 hypothetical protein [Ignavibacteriaceae bacterium]MEB2295479.1 hypothetical protein [Ignavibacteria bacterium]
MRSKKYQCEGCGYYWDIRSGELTPEQCPICRSKKIYRAISHKRFAKKARPKLRRSYSI